MVSVNLAEHSCPNNWVDYQITTNEIKFSGFCGEGKTRVPQGKTSQRRVENQQTQLITCNIEGNISGRRRFTQLL